MQIAVASLLDAHGEIVPGLFVHCTEGPNGSGKVCTVSGPGPPFVVAVPFPPHVDAPANAGGMRNLSSILGAAMSPPVSAAPFTTRLTNSALVNDGSQAFSVVCGTCGFLDSSVMIHPIFYCLASRLYLKLRTR